MDLKDHVNLSRRAAAVRFFLEMVDAKYRTVTPMHYTQELVVVAGNGASNTYSAATVELYGDEALWQIADFCLANAMELEQLMGEIEAGWEKIK